MRIAIYLALVLFCLAGFLTMTKQRLVPIEATGAQQEVKVANNLSAIRIERLSISNGVATFEAVNVSGEPLTAFVVHSGRYRVVVDTSYWDNKIDSGARHALSLNIDGAQPLTIDAVIYQSGKADGNQVDIEKVLNTRQGFKIGLAMMRSTIINNRSVESFKSALSNLPISETDFQSTSHYHGANDARNHVLEVLSRIEPLTDQPQIDEKMNKLRAWVIAKAK